jgi:hypothetical protein
MLGNKILEKKATKKKGASSIKNTPCSLKPFFDRTGSELPKNGSYYMPFGLFITPRIDASLGMPAAGI